MITRLLLGLIAATPAPAAPERRDECQYLAGRFEWDGFSSDTTARDGSFDGAGNAFAANALPAGDRLIVRSSRFGTVEFLRPPTDGAKPNMVPCKGQVIAVRTKRIFNVLAVEVHQSDATSSDLSFDAKLTSGRGLKPRR